jgi:hypothetical protein
MSRTTAAIILLGAGIVLNLIILFRGEEAAGWPVAAIILLGAAGAAMVTQRREP